jgi:hypothetical protein
VGDAAAVEGEGTMKFIDTFVGPQSGGLWAPRGIDYGPDGNLYVSSENNPSDPLGYVIRYDGVTGDLIDRFASDPSLNGAKDVEFGPDGNLYVPNNVGSNIYRFDGTTGSFMDVFVPSGSGGLTVARSVIFGPDGNGDGSRDLYVTSAQTDNVLRYDGVTGAFLDAFVPAGSGGLTDPTALVFGPDGNLYVASGAHSNYYNSILRFNGATGAFMDVFVPAGSAGLTLAPTAGVIFGPDASGDGTPDLYVSNGVADEVLIYSGANGSFLRKYLTPGLGGLNDPKGLLFDRDGNLLVVNNGDYSVRRFGASSQAVFTVSLSEPSSTPVTVDYSTADGTATVSSHYTAVSGTLTFPPGVTTRTVLVRTVNNTLVQGNTTFTLNLYNPVGATVTRAQGTATITDDDTKFYVVNDGSPDRTYEYGANGSAGENYSLNSGNTAPRGAVSTAAGDKVWVVDANRKVYVYNPSGVLLGSWTAGSLASNATPEGIATNGTDVWIVDSRSDKVFRYTSAASRLSGSQNAASSFALNSGNKDPKDLVTDGTNIWVINNSTTDKVFKYTLSGMLLGSWTMTGGGGSPTGITLDPAAPAHLWVVDNATDRVYQFDNAVGRTSGSQAASQSFALNPFNTNPQGIADPPMPSAADSDLALPGAAGVSWPAEPAGKPGPAADPRVERSNRGRNLFTEDWTGTSPPGDEGRGSLTASKPALAVARVGADWFAADEFDYSPIDVTTPGRKIARG